MTITTLILLLTTGIVAVTAINSCPGHDQNTSDLITNCCDLKFFTFARSKNPSGIYLLNILCKGNSIIADAYCDNCNGGGG